MMSQRIWDLHQWLSPFVIRVCGFFQTLWIKSYTINLASFYISAYAIRFYVLVKKFPVSMAPAVPILWQILLTVCLWFWNSFQILFYWLSLRTYCLLRYAWKHPGKALIRLCHGGYYVMVLLFQKDAYYIILRAIQYQLYFALVMSLLDSLEALIHKGIVKIYQLLLYIKSTRGPVNSVEACYISILSSGGLPVCQHFPGPMSPRMLGLFHSFSFLLVHVNLEDRVGLCHLETSEVSLNKPDKIEEEKNEAQSDCRLNLMHELKTTFVVFFIWYLYDTFLFIKIIK